MRTRMALGIIGLLTALTILNIYAGDWVTESLTGARNESTSVVEDESRMIDRTFKVDTGDKLEVRVGDADLRIRAGGSGEAHIEVFLDGRDMERARAYFESLRFTVEQEGRTVVVRTDPEQTWRNHRDGDAHVRIEATIPSTFDVDARTSDGDIDLPDALEGELTLTTSDGDVSAERLSGPSVSLKTSDGDVRLRQADADEVSLTTSDGDIQIGTLDAARSRVRTSDGDIRADALSGTSDVTTSDGDIRITAFEGTSLRLRTSDGTIIAERIYADEAAVTTSDGDISLREVSGNLEATTSSGDLTVGLLEPGTIYLRSSDGDITLSAPPDIAAEMRLKGEQVRVSSAFSFTGNLVEDRAEGQLNGGGPLLEANASDGTVTLREN